MITISFKKPILNQRLKTYTKTFKSSNHIRTAQCSLIKTLIIKNLIMTIAKLILI